jgi:hypothetical protein
MDGVSVDRRMRVGDPLASCGEWIERAGRTYAEEIEALLLRARYGGDDE